MNIKKSLKKSVCWADNKKVGISKCNDQHTAALLSLKMKHFPFLLKHFKIDSLHTTPSQSQEKNFYYF